MSDIPTILHRLMKTLERHLFLLNKKLMVKTAITLKPSTTLQLTTLETRLMTNSETTTRCSSQLFQWHNNKTIVPPSPKRHKCSLRKASTSWMQQPIMRTSKKEWLTPKPTSCSQMEDGNATSARTTTSRAAKPASDARRPSQPTIAKASLSTWWSHWKRPVVK